MQILSRDNKTLFLGYNVLKGSMANGTLTNIKIKQLIEMPIAENLIMGTAIGLSLAGFKPVVFLERFDFILNAMDSIVNHLDKIKEISTGEFSPLVMIRVVVGNKSKPLYTGLTHTGDYSIALKKMLKNIDVFTLQRKKDIRKYYSAVREWKKSTILVEYKDLYATE